MMTKETENKCRFCGPDPTSNSAHVGCFVKASARPGPPQYSGHTRQLNTDDDLESVDKHLEAIRRCKVGPQYFLLTRKAHALRNQPHHIFTLDHNALCGNEYVTWHGRQAPGKVRIVSEETAIRTGGYKDVEVEFGHLDYHCWEVFNTIAQLIRAGV